MLNYKIIYINMIQKIQALIRKLVKLIIIIKIILKLIITKAITWYSIFYLILIAPCLIMITETHRNLIIKGHDREAFYLLEEMLEKVNIKLTIVLKDQIKKSIKTSFKSISALSSPIFVRRKDRKLTSK